MSIESLIAAERRAQRRLLARAALLAALVGAASVTLLGLSGWFITAAAIAGAAGPVAAQAFNYMLPSAGIRLLAIVRTGARYGERLASHEAAFGALARIRPALFRALAAAPVERALALGTGEATARLVSDVDAVETRFVRLSAPFGVAAALASGLSLTILGGTGAAAATLACAGLTMHLADRLSRRVEAPGRAVQRAVGELREEFAMLVDAAPELRCFGLEAWAAERIDTRSRALGRAQRRQAQAAGWFELLQASAIGIAAAAALLLSLHAGAPVAALAALAAAMTLDSLAPLLRAMIERGRLREAQARLDEVLEVGAPPPAVTPILDLHLMPGERIAIVGPSGIGKTTLVETLIGLRGRVPDRQRERFAWAPQDAALLAGTVRENLLLAAPDAGDVTLWATLHDAALDERIRALGGLDAWVGENGTRLSGGERRRLSLARAYSASAPWLLLDEPSEGLDAATEALVAERLQARLDRTGQSLILVSHRPAMVAICPRILDLAAGTPALAA
ncbi:ATP-binding cassette domain-containing protein [Sphingomonas sp.]|uniref:amino acid ABC transporter ATP-binding/permease protein n=1 Tax=Sphingomonas sp. TaxID=28214 RepID=UPI001B238782|nr:ATP-binding cassette domain-containing protein [Sphingomonas sp.]MBO9713292.1 ATP-binding cassette domain-containing protein [Sphingomonas sp.]